MTMILNCGCGRHLNEFEGGRLIVKDGVKILDLHGGWKEMGRQYGCLGQEDLLAVMDYLCMEVGEPELRNGCGFDSSSRSFQVLELADKLYCKYPENLKLVFEGMAETSGLTLEQLKIINAVEYAEGLFACSGVAVWDEYSADGKVVYGRNYDAMHYGELAKQVAITVYHPNDGSLAVATIGHIGEIYAVNGFNEKGLFLELNNGMSTTGFDLDWTITPSTTELLELMFRAKNMDDLDCFFKETPSFAGFIIGVADAHEARAYEWSREGTLRGDGILDVEQAPEGFEPKQGVSVVTNHFVNPDWNCPVFCNGDVFCSMPRRRNIARFLEENKGRIDADMMMKFMGTPIGEGGPAFKKEEGKDPQTLYQMVVMPEKKQLYLQVSGNNSWTLVDLGQYL